MAYNGNDAGKRIDPRLLSVRPTEYSIVTGMLCLAAISLVGWALLAFALYRLG